MASSENLLRAIIGEWEGLNEVELAGVDVPYATPLVYQLDADLVPPYTAPSPPHPNPRILSLTLT